MRQMAGMLDKDEKVAVEIAELMNDDESSILHQRIKMFDGRLPKGYKRPYVNLKTFSVLLLKYIINEIPGNAISTKKEVIERYFRAWSEIFPEAWEDDQKHVLVKAMGFSIMGGLFPKIFEIASAKSHSDAPKQADFERVIEVLKDMKIDPEDVSSNFSGTASQEAFDLDWRSETFGWLSSGKGINLLV